MPFRIHHLWNSTTELILLYIEIILTTIPSTVKFRIICMYNVPTYIDTPDYSVEIGKYIGVCIAKSFLGQRKGELKVFVWISLKNKSHGSNFTLRCVPSFSRFLVKSRYLHLDICARTFSIIWQPKAHNFDRAHWIKS